MALKGFLLIRDYQRAGHLRADLDPLSKIYLNLN